MDTPRIRHSLKVLGGIADKIEQVPELAVSATMIRIACDRIEAASQDEWDPRPLQKCIRRNNRRQRWAKFLSRVKGMVLF